MAAADEILTHLTSVSGHERIGPRLVRLTLAGGLERFVPLGGDQFAFLLLPPLEHPEITIGLDFSWEANALEPAERQVTGAYYSVRRCRPSASTGGVDAVEMWCVLHGMGRTSEWVERAQIGDQVAVWGPRRLFRLPAQTDELVIVTDETGWGATAAILDELGCLTPDTTPSILVIAETDAVANPIDRPACFRPCGLDVEIEWVGRNGAAPGQSPVLLDAVRRRTIGPSSYVYGAGESRQMAAIRRYLRHEVGLAPTQVEMVPYWRRGSTC